MIYSAWSEALSFWLEVKFEQKHEEMGRLSWIGILSGSIQTHMEE